MIWFSVFSLLLVTGSLSLDRPTTHLLTQTVTTCARLAGGGFLMQYKSCSVLLQLYTSSACSVVIVDFPNALSRPSPFLQRMFCTVPTYPGLLCIAHPPPSPPPRHLDANLKDQLTLPRHHHVGHHLSIYLSHSFIYHHLRPCC